MLTCASATAIPLPDESVQCVVTSPPYWGLRKYAGEQELVWGGADGCEHEWADAFSRVAGGGYSDKSTLAGFTNANTRGRQMCGGEIAKQGTCRLCGSWRGAYGLEPTVEMYVAHTVQILREIRRVLRKDGVVFWNVGDSYSGSGKGIGSDHGKAVTTDEDVAKTDWKQSGLKPKDLCLIPQRVMLAAQADGWWVRSDIIWSKPNPMPESVTDRPTDAYEHIIMLTKSAKYFWDAEAVKEPSQPIKVCGKNSRADVDRDVAHGTRKQDAIGKRTYVGFNERYAKAIEDGLETGRNLRNVWTFPTQPYSGAHFATFPEELPRRCIKAASKPGDVVLDPFGGSGTTGRVAIELGRSPILLDIAYGGGQYDMLADKRTRNVQIALNAA